MPVGGSQLRCRFMREYLSTSKNALFLLRSLNNLLLIRIFPLFNKRNELWLAWQVFLQRLGDVEALWGLEVF